MNDLLANHWFAGRSLPRRIDGAGMPGLLGNRKSDFSYPLVRHTLLGLGFGGR
jgi:hypothetical protein